MNFVEQTLAPGLYLVAVPIGTARDITLRALDILASASVLAAEDTRALRRLMDIHGIPLRGRRIVALHEHSKQHVESRLLDAVAEGESVAYASEAGMPLIADPGFELVRGAAARGLALTCAPGPSAVTTALAVSGLAPDAFHFVGFLPSSASRRRSAFESLKEVPATLVLFEAPGRVVACLRDAAQVLGPDREAAICRELTKKFEEVRRGRLSELAEQMADAQPRGEHVLLISRPAQEENVSETLVEEMLRSRLRELSLKDAVAEVAEETGRKRRQVYQLALRLSREK